MYLQWLYNPVGQLWPTKLLTLNVFSLSLKVLDCDFDNIPGGLQLQYLNVRVFYFIFFCYAWSSSLISEGVLQLLERDECQTWREGLP